MVTLDHQEGAGTILAIWQSSDDEREAYYLPDAFGTSYIGVGESASMKYKEAITD